MIISLLANGGANKGKENERYKICVLIRKVGPRELITKLPQYGKTCGEGEHYANRDASMIN